jgi:hypothetical protein
MADKTESEQVNIGKHVRNVVFADEVAALSKVAGEEEFLSVASDYLGILEFHTDKSGTTVSDLNTKWTSHKDGCSDCTGWRL